MSRFELYFHIVWSTQYRRPLLIPIREAAAYRCALEQVLKFKHELLAINGTEDHVHLVIKAAPVLDLPALMKQVKGVASSLLNDMADHSDHFRWQEGYYAVTVSPRDLPRIIAYVKNQKEHHRKGNVIREWEEPDEP